MKFSVKADNFKRIAAIVSKIISTKGSGLTCYMAANKAGVSLTTGKDGRFITATCPCECEVEGQVVTNNEWLASLRLRTNQIAFKQNKTGLQFASGAFNGQLDLKQDGSQIDDSKPIKEIDTLITLPTQLLKDALKRANIPSTDDNRCVKIIVKNNTLFMHTNDSYAGAYLKTGLTDQVADCEVIIPHSVLSCIVDFIDTDTFEFGTDESMMRFVTTYATPNDDDDKKKKKPTLVASFDCYYPTKQAAVFNVFKTMKDIRTREKTQASFVVTIKETLETLNDIATLGKSALEDIPLTFTFGDSISIGAKLPFGVVNHTIEATELEATKNCKVQIASNILTGMLSLLNENTAKIEIFESSVIISGTNVFYLFPLLALSSKQ